MVFSTSSARRKAIRRLTALPLSLLLCLVFTITSLAHDAEYGMWHGEQDALIIGTIEEIDGTLCRVTVNHAFTCGPEGAEKHVIDHMLPVDEIPDSLTADLTGYDGQIHSYVSSYHGKARPERGDIVLLSLDKKDSVWDAVWPPCEVSGADPGTLELLPDKEKNGTAAAWEVFIRSDGAINDFKSIENDMIIAYVRQEDGSITEETVWEKMTGDSAEEADAIAEDRAASVTAGMEETTSAVDSGRADGQQNRERETGEGSYRSNFWPLIAVFVVICLISIALGSRIRKHFRKK